MEFHFPPLYMFADRMQQSTVPRAGVSLEVQRKQRTVELGPGLPCLVQPDFLFSLSLTSRTSSSFSTCNILLTKRSPVGEGKLYFLAFI